MCSPVGRGRCRAASRERTHILVSLAVGPPGWEGFHGPPSNGTASLVRPGGSVVENDYDYRFQQHINLWCPRQDYPDRNRTRAPDRNGERRVLRPTESSNRTAQTGGERAALPAVRAIRYRGPGRRQCPHLRHHGTGLSIPAGPGVRGSGDAGHFHFRIGGSAPHC